MASLSPRYTASLEGHRSCLYAIPSKGFCPSRVIEEVKGLGFDPSKLNFSVALLAKRAITKSQWDAKVDAFKTWGWSEDAILYAFRRQPNFMLRSTDKLNAVMRFWVGQLGWDPSVLQASPVLFGFSLEKRLIPRASVVQYLLSRGLMKKGASLITPFSLSDKLFLQRFVKYFEEEETSRILRIYQGGC
ncbi:Transcription termination factor, mitochondrial/chloroplastic [Sesbania bispinosa]|nr:Transcription termination factor, mitochondrial/chloroplastic [Sesbania bispinosa]